MARARTTPDNQEYAIGLARAFGGALIFAFPLLMTMEMWELGFYMDRTRLALFLALGLPLLFGLSYFAGFRTTRDWRDDLLDALAAYAVGFIAAAALLWLFSVIGPDMPVRETVGKVALQAVPGGIGALLARKQFGQREDDGGPEEGDGRKGYASELFLMTAGALFIAFNVAPTEEMVLIAYQMSPWHALTLAGVSLAVLHALVFSVGFAGQEEGHGSGSTIRTFLFFTLVGYAIALLVSLYILWTFSRTDSGLNGELLKTVIVLGFPSSIGAAAARLLV